MKTTPTDCSSLTIGLDLGDRRHRACVLNAKGKIEAEFSCPNDHAGIIALSARFPRATIAMETGTHSPWISRLIESRGHRLFVATALQHARIVYAGGMEMGYSVIL